jgi:Calcineurin-like phosphoesterase
VRTIAHLSDLHFGRHDETVAERLLGDLREAQPDLIVITGDLTQRGRHRQFAAARAFLEKLPPPILVVPGNHDVPLYDIVERFLGRLARYRRYICAEQQPFSPTRKSRCWGSIPRARPPSPTDGSHTGKRRRFVPYLPMCQPAASGCSRPTIR